MFVQERLETSISNHPSVEGTKVKGLQALDQQVETILKSRYSTIGSVYEDLKKSDEPVFLSFDEMKRTGIDILCDDHGLYVIASCLGFQRVPVYNREYDIGATLAYHPNMDPEPPKYLGINIFSMSRKD